MRARGIAAAFLALLYGSGTGHAASGTAHGEGFALTFDGAVWQREETAPPQLLRLHCIAPACSDRVVVSVLRDARSMPSPGFGAFGPGAASGAAIDLRLQSLAPGVRLLGMAPVRPVALGGATGYRGPYALQDRTLAKTDAQIVLLRLSSGTLEIRLNAGRLSPADIAAFDRLLSQLAVQN